MTAFTRGTRLWEEIKMADLREKLATRLLTAYGEGYERVARPDPDNPGGTVINVVEAWNCVADECIRQMEWARTECVESVDSYDAGNSWLKNKSLTPAPDDWKPE